MVILNVYRRIAASHSVRILTPYLSESLIQKSGSNEYDRYVNFEVRRYHDRFSLMKLRGHKASLGMIPPFSLSAVGAMNREIRRFQPDVINVHYVMPTGLAGLYAQKIKKIPVVITYNGRDVPGPGVPPLWKYWHQLIGRNSAAVTFVSAYCRDVIYGPGFRQGHIIYNGVEAPAAAASSRICELRSRLGIEDHARILFALQRLDPLKRVDVLIQSMPTILQHFPRTHLIVGGKGSDLTRLKNTAQALNLADRVHFAGYISQDELPLYFNLADLFVFHSTYETFGMVLAEAMNYCKAIVSVDSSAIKEVVDNGENGILVPPLNAVAFGEAVVQLLGDRQKRHAFGQHGKQKVQELFLWEKIAGQYETVLRKAVTWS